MSDWSMTAQALRVDRERGLAAGVDGSPSRAIDQRSRHDIADR